MTMMMMMMMTLLLLNSKCQESMNTTLVDTVNRLTPMKAAAKLARIETDQYLQHPITAVAAAASGSQCSSGAWLQNTTPRRRRWRRYSC